MPSVEIVNPDHPRGGFRIALWDFDGTLSLYRGGWQQVMVEMMVAELALVSPQESKEQLAQLAEHWIVSLTGKPTIHQMRWLADEVASRGGIGDVENYCRTFQHQLVAIVQERIAEVKRGNKLPLAHAVAGVENMLAALSQRGIQLVLASGTEREYVEHELHALGLQDLFGKHVYAPDGHDATFSKASVIERLLSECDVPGNQLLGFGDGVVETADVKRYGGCAVGVASDEDHRPGPDADKRRRLIAAGADLIIPNFLDCEPLLAQLGL